jgi:hypothetical protein
LLILQKLPRSTATATVVSYLPERSHGFAAVFRDIRSCCGLVAIDGGRNKGSDVIADGPPLSTSSLFNSLPQLVSEPDRHLRPPLALIAHNVRSPHFHAREHRPADF